MDSCIGRSVAATQLIPASPLGAAEQSPFQTRLLFSSFLVILGSLTSQGSGHCNKGGERQWFPRLQKAGGQGCWASRAGWKWASASSALAAKLSFILSKRAVHSSPPGAEPPYYPILKIRHVRPGEVGATQGQLVSSWQNRIQAPVCSYSLNGVPCPMSNP